MKYYKAVRPDGTDFYTGTIKYEVEMTVQIECPCGWRLDLKDASQKTSAWVSFFSHLTTDGHTDQNTAVEEEE